MKAISIKQPWVWALLHGKDVENRNWRYLPKFRGPILLHASKGFDRDGYQFINDNAPNLFTETIRIPEIEEFRRGGIVAKGEIIDAVREMDSPWFFGPIGIVISKVDPVEFFPCRGQLGFFDVDYRNNG